MVPGVFCARLVGRATVKDTVWRAGRGAESLAALCMLAAETEAAEVNRLCT
jgi:hypothetical protein